jgi:hypothetical protein
MDQKPISGLNAAIASRRACERMSEQACFDEIPHSEKKDPARREGENHADETP